MPTSHFSGVRKHFAGVCLLAGAITLLGQAIPRSSGSKLPAECKQQDLLLYGTPVFFPAEKGVAFGLSMERLSFRGDQKPLLHLWVDNDTDAEIHVMSCEDLDFFKTRGFDLYDHQGHLVLSNVAMKIREKCGTDPEGANAGYSLFVCTLNFKIPIAAHTCITRNDYPFTLDMSSQYELSPQTYGIHFRENWKDGKLPNICELQLHTRYGPMPQDLRFVIEP